MTVGVSCRDLIHIYWLPVISRLGLHPILIICCVADTVLDNTEIQHQAKVIRSVHSQTARSREEDRQWRANTLPFVEATCAVKATKQRTSRVERKYSYSRECGLEELSGDYSLRMSQLCKELGEESSRHQERGVHRPWLGRLLCWNPAVKGEGTAAWNRDPSCPLPPLLKFLKTLCSLWLFTLKPRLEPFDY